MLTVDNFTSEIRRNMADDAYLEYVDETTEPSMDFANLVPEENVEGNPQVVKSQFRFLNVDVGFDIY